MTVKNWQTRSETNGLQFFETESEAWAEADKDATVWKVSGPGHRYIRQRYNSWKDEPMDNIIKETVKKYKEIMSDPLKRTEFESELMLWDETVGDGLDNV